MGIKQFLFFFFFCFSFDHSLSLRLSLVSQSFFRTIKTTLFSPSSLSWSSSEPVVTFSDATTSQCRAFIYFLIDSTMLSLSLMMMNPVGLRILSISSNRSSTLHPLLLMSEKTVHACNRSYVRGYVEKASHLTIKRNGDNVNYYC